ncbi:hypothetical protein HK102_002553, partial [Quaeritorhiza haematococci]
MTPETVIIDNFAAGNPTRNALGGRAGSDGVSLRIESNALFLTPSTPHAYYYSELPRSLTNPHNFFDATPFSSITLILSTTHAPSQVTVGLDYWDAAGAQKEGTVYLDPVVGIDGNARRFEVGLGGVDAGVKKRLKAVVLCGFGVGGGAGVVGVTFQVLGLEFGNSGFAGQQQVQPHGPPLPARPTSSSSEPSSASSSSAPPLPHRPTHPQTLFFLIDNFLAPVTTNNLGAWCGAEHARFSVFNHALAITPENPNAYFFEGLSPPNVNDPCFDATRMDYLVFTACAVNQTLLQQQYQRQLQPQQQVGTFTIGFDYFDQAGKDKEGTLYSPGPQLSSMMVTYRIPLAGMPMDKRRRLKAIVFVNFNAPLGTDFYISELGFESSQPLYPPPSQP